MVREYKPSNFDDMVLAAQRAARAAREAGADHATIKRSAFAAAEALAVHEDDPRPEFIPAGRPPAEQPAYEEPVFAPALPMHLPPVEDPAKDRMDV